MVSDPGRTTDTRRIRRLKQPRAIEVQAREDGTPGRVRIGGDWKTVRLARNPWRIDQHWWRPGPAGGQVRRTYYRVEPQDGPPITIYRDMLTGEWRKQDQHMPAPFVTDSVSDTTASD
ncbi:MAG TPA: hypothetical protein VFX19_05505 [Dehalococcoidia bacterium]|nr:hypothetical protein [Dehalococcoidia bacterium]